MNGFEQRITSLTAYAAQRFGDACAVIVPSDLELTFTQIDARVARVAGGLLARGVKAGDRVVLHLPNGWEWIVAYHAIARAGAVVVPANVVLAVDEVTFIVGHSQARMLICPAERHGSFLRSGVDIITLGTVEGATSFEDLLGAEAVAPVDRSPNDLFTIGYTSGTTGRPKGAMLSYGNIFASLAATATMHVRHAHDVVLSSLPFPHVYGNIVMNATFIAGARLVSPARFDAGDTLRLIETQRVTLFEGVPTMYYKILEHPDYATANLSSLTRCTVGGQKMPDATIAAVIRNFRCPLLELWGMTELGGPAITHSPYWPPHSGSIGRVLPGTEARVADPNDASRNAPPNVAGELLVRGAQVMAGYWHDPAATAAAIDAAGWLATGDIATVDDEGYFTIVDRKKDVIITGGYNVYPAEIEQVIASHPDVVMSAVVGVADPEKGEVVCAAVVSKSSVKIAATDVIDHCRGHLAAYKLPRRVIFVADLPKTSTGKIMRRVVHAWFCK